MRVVGAHTIILMLVIAACDGHGSAGVADSAFVQTMTELRRVAAAPGMDSAGRVAARAAVLQRRGLTPARLERAARALADDPDHAAEVWHAIETAPSASPGAAGSPGAQPGDSAARASGSATPPAATPARN